MGSSNNFYQQALHENKLLQMKILELKHKAALYEVCLGSIASILKDLPLQQNVNDTRQGQNAALHKIANVLTHIETVVRSNTEPQLVHQNPAHNPLHQHLPKLFSWPGNNMSPGKRHYAGPPYHPTELPLNFSHLGSSSTNHFSNFAPGETQSHDSLNKPGSPQILGGHDPVHVSTLSIHKCMKSPETPHTVGAMTISPIKIPQNFPMVIRRPIPVSGAKSVFPYPPPHAAGAPAPHFIERKRGRESEIFEDLLRKKAAATATMDSTGALDLQTKQKPSDQNPHVYKHTIEYLATNQQQKNDTTGPHPMMTVQSGNPFLQEKRSHHHQMLNGGNIIVNMSKSTNSDSTPKWNPVGIKCCNNKNCNGCNSKSNSRPGTATPVISPALLQPVLYQAMKSFEVMEKSPTKVASSPVEKSTTQKDEQLPQSDSDCTIIN